MDGMNALIAKGFGPFPSVGAAMSEEEDRRLRNELARMKIAEQKQIMADMPEARKRQEQAAKVGEFKTGLDLLQAAHKMLPSISYEQYPALRQQFAGAVPQAAQFLPESFGSPEEFEAWKGQMIPQIEDTVNKIKEVRQLSKELYGLDWRQLSPQQKQDVMGKVYPGQKEQTSEFDKTIEKYNSLPANDPNKQFYLARIKKMSESSGLQIRVNKDGTVEIIQGPMGAATPGLTKSTETEIEKKILSSADALQRLGEIETAFKPEYQELGTQWSAWKSATKEKLGQKLQPHEQQLLSDFSEYKRKSIHNLNLYIKDITGAQLTVQEAERLTKGMPNPGMGMLGGDSPTQFKTKLSGIMTELRMAIARNSYIRKHGLKMEALSLGAMKNIINDRANEIEQELIKQGMRGKELEQQVIGQLGEEFGLVR